jgi:hypothetical protein
MPSVTHPAGAVTEDGAVYLGSIVYTVEDLYGMLAEGLKYDFVYTIPPDTSVRDACRGQLCLHDPDRHRPAHQSHPYIFRNVSGIGDTEGN